MTTRDIIEKFYSAYSVGDVETALSLFHPNVRHRACPQNQAIDHCGCFEGLEAVKERIGMILRDWTFKAYQPEFILADGDRAAALVHIEAVGNQSGEAIEIQSAHFWRVKDGLVVEADEIFDTGTVDAGVRKRAG
ncbi:MAG: nuclear transport factor 2 family protein [Pseudomonadota bacterium]